MLSSKKSPNVSHLQVLKPVLFYNGRLSEPVHLLADGGNFFKGKLLFQRLWSSVAVVLRYLRSSERKA